MTKNLTMELELVHENLASAHDELAALMDGAIAEATKKQDVERLGDLVEILDRIKKDADNARKLINKNIDRVNEHFCNVLFDKELMPYREHELATFSPTAKGHFYISEPRRFLDWLTSEGAEDPLGQFVECSQKKTALRSLCDEKLEAGLPLPPGTKGHIIRSVTIRRKGQ